MELKDLKNKSKEDLVKLLENTREEVRDLRFKVSAGSLKRINLIKLKKRTVARILTIINAK